MNVDHEPFGDIRVRRAIQTAIDAEEINDGAYFGAATVSTGIIAPGLEGYWDVERPNPDREKARQLLAEAGFPSGFDTHITVLNSDAQVAACQIIQAQLAQIGVNVEVRKYEGGTFWNLGLEVKGDDWKDLQLIFQQWTSSPDPNRATQWFTTAGVGDWNWERWRSDEYTRLNEEAFTSVDANERDMMYQRMMQVMWEDAAYVPINHAQIGWLVARSREHELHSQRATPPASHRRGVGPGSLRRRTYSTVRWSRVCLGWALSVWSCDMRRYSTAGHDVPVVVAGRVSRDVRRAGDGHAGAVFSMPPALPGA